jgi:iron complex outermembrane receptor protein
VRNELIASQVPSSPGRVFYQNAGRSVHQGLELEGGVQLLRDVRLDANWTWSDFRYRNYFVRGQQLAGRRLPGIPVNLVHLTWSAAPSFARGGWIEVQQTYASGYLVDDTLATRTSPWHTLDVRAGWNGRVGRARVEPFAAVTNVLDRSYVSSVVINAANGRYYEPAPRRAAYFGMTLAAGR